MNKPQRIEITLKTILLTLLTLASVGFLYFIRDVLFQIFISILIMAILNPTVTKLNKRKVPRVLSVFLVYVFVIAFIIFSVAIILPPLVDQTRSFVNSLPRYLEELSISPSVVDEVGRQFAQQAGIISSRALKIGVSIFSNIFAVITVFIIAFYLLVSRDKLHEQLKSILNKSQVEFVDNVLDGLENKLGGWARGQIILMFLVGLFNYIGLLLLGIPFALPLALIAGIFEIIPNIGPVLGAVPSVLVGFGISPVTGLAAAALGFLIQQVENYVFVPKVMEKSAGVSPVITLLALVVGFKVAGIVGAMISVPVVLTVEVVTREIVAFSKR